ncbi:MAG: SusC/RagA family TonB-linked outer membrane protein [Flavobacteriales bacterium 32-35-8]|nr:MAG: SusC/RagA family TonB-linked outer membrane protein [Flavobacteriales bacterium 32-35-8]
MTKFLFFKKEGIKHLGFLMLVFVFCSSMNAQIRVSGTVSDQNGPLPGVTVIVDGTSNGVATDFDGKYTLSNVASNATIVISYVGFVTQRIAVNGRTSINVTLAEDLQALDEVVVVGYGAQTRAAVTGAISTVKTEDIAALPVANAVEALQGRAAGVNVINTGAPGSEPVVNIRGISTFGNSTPLYVIDGVIVGNLSGISQNDIETINVLKDASTTAVYGSQGSNGVIIVTTKKGKSGVSKFEANIFTGFQSQTKRYDVLNTQQYLQYASEAFGANINNAASNSGVNTNWQDEIHQNGIVRNYDFAISGGSDKGTFRFSGGYNEKEGVIINTGFEKFAFRANSDFNFGKVRVGQTMSVNFNTTKPEATSGGRSNIEHAIKMAPYYGVYNPDNLGGFQGVIPNIDGGNDAENPVRVIRHGDRLNNQFSLIGNIYAAIDIAKGLEFKTQVSLDYYTSNNYNFTPSFYDGPAHQQPFANISKNRGSGQTIIYTNSLTYKTTVAEDHDFELLLLSEKFENRSSGMNANVRNNVTNELNQLQNDLVQSLGSNNDEYNRLGYLARLNYNYKDKYIASGSFRRDASSRFGANNRWGDFWSASLGWNIAKEDFMSDSVFSNLKLRASTGISGNDRIGNYRYVSSLSSNYFYVFNGVQAVGTTTGGLGNQDLKWEELKNTNIGLDFGLFNEKITGAIEYYINESDGLLMNAPLPVSMGDPNGNVPSNVGSTETKGFEITLGYNDREGDFKWSVNANLGTTKGTAKYLGGVDFIEGGGFENEQLIRLVPGQPLYHFHGLIMDGIYQTQAEVDAVFTADPTQTIVRPGDIRYKDISGPNGVPDGRITNDDKTIIGSAIPDFTYGLNFDATYKNFDFNVFFNGVQGRDIMNTNIYDLEGMPRLFNAGVGVLNRWTGPGTSNSVPRAGGAPQNLAISTRYLEDGSFLRLRNLTIGYTLPNNVLGQDLFSKFRIYVSGQNLFTITDYSGLDPEVANGGAFESGIDRGAYPQPKTYLVGLQLSF